MSFVKNLLGDSTSVDDKFIALNMSGALKAGATAYLAGTLEAATPEIRKMYFGFVNEVVQTHERVTSFLNERGWFKVYGEPKMQLETALGHTTEVVHPHAH